MTQWFQEVPEIVQVDAPKPLFPPEYSREALLPRRGSACLRGLKEAETELLAGD